MNAFCDASRSPPPEVTMMDRLRLALSFVELASAAGAAIMTVYEREIVSTLKEDGSPVTRADQLSEEVICTGLARLLPRVPVIAEEGTTTTSLPLARPDLFLLVDPLDGTREFLKRNGEFTVNIALIENGEPTVGCVFAPALSRLFLGVVGIGAWHGILRPGTPLEQEALKDIRVRAAAADRLVAVVSASHNDADTEQFLASLPIIARRAIGSSLKFCLVAAGEADLYPRFGPTMPWDTAAGAAVVRSAGGRVLKFDGQDLVYQATSIANRNPPFVCIGDTGIESLALKAAGRQGAGTPVPI